MASKQHNLSEYNPSQVPNGNGMRIGIAVSEWNSQITESLLQGAITTLQANGVQPNDICVYHVPGSFELIYSCSQLVKEPVDAVIAIGCVIRGDTPHFDYICEGTTYGLSRLNATQDIPVIYGLITTNSYEQALDRCGGKLGNKGDECAVTALKMIRFRQQFLKKDTQK